jgi:hypothetical protein
VVNDEDDLTPERLVRPVVRSSENDLHRALAGHTVLGGELLMKPRLIKALIVAGLVLGAWRLGQARAEVAQFRITIQRSETGVNMECSQGCAWKTLSFSLDGKQAQAVDGMGMAK